MSKRTKAGRRASFLRYVTDPNGAIADQRWWEGIGPVRRREMLSDGGFLKADARPTAEQPRVVDVMLPMVTIDRTRPQPAWVVFRNKP